MTTGAYCLDSSVLVKVLVPEQGSDEASALLRRAVASGCRLVVPAMAWAEVGTVLRKKLRAGLISESEADLAWERFASLALEYLQDARMPRLAWGLCTKFGLPTMYDAAFLAVCERVAEQSRGAAEFWTSDRDLVDSLGDSVPAYVHLLPTEE